MWQELLDERVVSCEGCRGAAQETTHLSWFENVAAEGVRLRRAFERALRARRLRTSEGEEGEKRIARSLPPKGPRAQLHAVLLNVFSVALWQPCDVVQLKFGQPEREQHLCHPTEPLEWSQPRTIARLPSTTPNPARHSSTFCCSYIQPTRDVEVAHRMVACRSGELNAELEASFLKTEK